LPTSVITMPTPTDDELDILITARLALVGIDLGQLPTEPDPATGSPTRLQALASLRAFLTTTVPAIAGWLPTASGADAPAYAQQLDPPSIYPSIDAGRIGVAGTGAAGVGVQR